MGLLPLREPALKWHLGLEGLGDHAIAVVDGDEVAPVRANSAHRRRAHDACQISLLSLSSYLEGAGRTVVGVLGGEDGELGGVAHAEGLAAREVVVAGGVDGVQVGHRAAYTVHSPWTDSKRIGEGVANRGRRSRPPPSTRSAPTSSGAPLAPSG